MPDAKILIVEDEAIEALDIQQRLVSLGYPLPDVAYNGEEGVRKAEKTRPDLVLMDIMMPGKIDGVAAAEQIRSRFDIPIIFLTAYADENTLRRAKITAPYGYIVKPFQERELHITVDMALYRHKMERELHEREKWLSTTLRSIGDAVVATDEKGLITFINPVAEALLGFKLEEVRQRNLTEVFNIVNRDTRKPVENPVTRVLLEGNIVGLANHTVLISRDGKDIPINDSAAPIKDDQGNILGVILVFSDVSEREKTAESLRESQRENEFLAGLIRASSQSVAIGYPDGRLGLFNRAFEKLTGYAADELRSINWATALTPPEWLEMERDKLAELHRTGQSVHYEKEYIRKDGTRVPVELLVHLVSDSEGKPQYYYAFLTDLTERKQAEEKVIKLNEELRRNVAELSVANASLHDSRRAALNLMEDSIAARKRAEEANTELQNEVTERKKAEANILKLGEDMTARNVELESANKEMETFIYSISHDLRAPIRTMSGFAKILHEDYAGQLDATGQDYLDRILRGSDKSTQLIDDLLRLSKISRQELDRIETDLSNRASKVVDQLREMNPGRDVEVVVQEDLTASVDPRLIELVLSNLLGNSWKFTSKTERARIEFGAFECGMRNVEFGIITQERCEQGKTVYFIRDNGAGFDMTYADKMFWPFHRLHTDKEFEGTGIGLTIVERIIHRHGGRIWAEGGVGKGAAIFFTLG